MTPLPALAKCPLCGRRPQVVPLQLTDGYQVTHYTATHTIRVYGRTERECIERWNRLAKGGK